MSRIPLTLLALALAAWLSACGGGAQTPQELAGRYAEAHEAHDLEALRRLVCWDRVSASTRASIERQIETELDRDIAAVRLEELSGDFELEYALDGVTYRPNLEPVRRLRIEFAPVAEGQPSRSTSMSFLVGVKDGAYLITAVAPVTEPTDVAGGPG